MERKDITSRKLPRRLRQNIGMPQKSLLLLSIHRK